MLFLKVLILSIIFIAIAFVGFATQIIFRKGGRFPNTSVGGNKALRDMGISCPKCEEQARCALAKKHESAVA